MKRNRFHSVCPYFAMFPESFAEYWVKKLTEPGDLIFDPFCGRGTAPFQALLMNRTALAGDINPVAYCITKAKTNAPSVSTLRSRITWLRGRFRVEDWEEEAETLPEFFHIAYAPAALRQILYLRKNLRWRELDSDGMIAALMLGALHGESNKSQRYLSNQMPRTISTKPGYSVRFWRRHGFEAPRRDVFELLRDQVDFRYASPLPSGKATVLETDFRDFPRVLRKTNPGIRLAVTSPPYLDTTRHEEDQWLRLWFLGGPPRPTYGRVSRDDRHENPETYWRLISDIWRVLGRVMPVGSHVVIRLGAKRLKDMEIVNGLQASSVFSQRSVKLVSYDVTALRKRQTHSFRPGSSGCSHEVDCCFCLN